MAALFDKVGLNFKVSQVVNTALPQTSPEEITQKINAYRVSHSLKALAPNQAICQIKVSDTSQSATDQVLSACPTCNHASLISISQLVSPNELLTALIGEDSTNSTLLDKDATILCVSESGNLLHLLFAQEKPMVTRAPITPRTIQPSPKPTPNSPKNFTEVELWQALSEYRRAHQRSSLTQDEALCVYARKRVEQHLSLMSEKKAADYPNPDKYPLDAHQGFTRDAESGLAFDVTGKNHLAENLAYWPDAEYPHQVIEWGWDSSTEGHREAQLSNDWNSGCITNKSGFYVAIFGN